MMDDDNTISFEELENRLKTPGKQPAKARTQKPIRQSEKNKSEFFNLYLLFVYVRSAVCLYFSGAANTEKKENNRKEIVQSKLEDKLDVQIAPKLLEDHENVRVSSTFTNLSAVCLH